LETTTEPVAAVSPEPVSEPAQEAQSTEPESTTEPEPESTEPEPDARVVPKPSEYEPPEGLPDNIRIFAHEHEFTQDQLNASLGFFSQYMQANEEQYTQARRELGQAVVKSWGAEANTNKALALQATQLLNEEIPGFSDYVKKTGVIDDPYVIQALHVVGKWGQEGGFITTGIPRPPGEKSVADAMYGDSHPQK